MAETYQNHKTLCWDCEKSLGGCSWADKFIPVKGWTAIKTQKRQNTKESIDSFDVYECPQFERDAMNGGLYRLKGHDERYKQVYPGDRQAKR